MRARTTTRGVLVSALCALIVGLALLALIAGFSSDPAIRTLEVLAVVCFGAMIIGGTIVIALVRLADWRLPVSDREFDRIVRRVEQLALEEDLDPYELSGEERQPDAYATHPPRSHRAPDGMPADADGDAEFRAIVRSAIDELPLEFTRALEHVAVVVSDGGAAVKAGNGRRGAYGLYEGDTIARDYFHDRILIFRDTLVRDFGHDPELLREQVVRTVRHELAHHLGYGEDGVRRIGL